MTKKLLLSKDRQREILREIAEDDTRPTMARLRVIEIDAKLAGHFAPERVEIEKGRSNLDDIRERAKNMASALAILV